MERSWIGATHTENEVEKIEDEEERQESGDSIRVLNQRERWWSGGWGEIKNENISLDMGKV